MLAEIETIPLEAESLLVENLAAYGIHYLRLSQPSISGKSLTPASLIAALAGHSDPRLRESLIALFLRQPQLHQYVPALTASLEPETADVLRHFYTAAAYLQRFWFSMLQLYLGTFPLLPNYFGLTHYHLPPLEEHFGETGLRALADYYTNQTGYDWLSAYQSAISLLLTQLNLEQMTHG